MIISNIDGTEYHAEALWSSVKLISRVSRQLSTTVIESDDFLFPVKGSDGTITGASKIARDITDRKMMEQQLLDLAGRRANE